MINLKLLKMFSLHELNCLVSGVNVGIDIDDLKQYTVYSGPYDEKHPTIVMFWNVLKSLPQEDLRKFLKFTTSCSRPPLLGFKQLEPRFGVRYAGEDIERLPSASTCFNLLKLPPYKDEKSLKEKLIYAVTAGTTFELS